MKPRPVYLNLLQIRQPLPAIVSVLHRVSGVILFLLLPLLLWLLAKSLASEASFNALKQPFTHPVLRFFIWVTLSALIYHLVAGIRHLLMDMGVGESLKGGRAGAYLVLVISIVLIIFAGICLW
ncbi:MAG TPA: succinate dehydrogenase, cytochrome b556 subunit [Gammaproteobacteria bacterium]|nr:succinate dehydrogenase, cytochrome b556 subunit [Gammaproteobacteria bacterium]